MTVRVFRSAEESDYICAIHDNWPLIQEVHRLPLPTMVDDKTSRDIHELRRVPGVLAPDLSLQPKFRSVVDDVAKGRKVEEFSRQDIDMIGVRRDEWRTG